MKRWHHILAGTVVWVIAAGGAVSADVRTFQAAPSRLPGTSEEMQSAAFWVGLHPAPDHVIMDQAGVEELNMESIRRGIVADVAAFPDKLEGLAVRAELEQSLNRFRSGGYYLPDGSKAGEDFFAPIVKQAGLDHIPLTVPVEFGVITSNVDQRLIPTARPLYAQPFDVDFDEVQNSVLDIGEPVAVLWRTPDGYWLYVKAAQSAGWVRASDVGLCSREEIQRWIMEPDFVVITAARADVYKDRRRQHRHAALRMGRRLPLTGWENKDLLGVFVPARRQVDNQLLWNHAYVDRADANAGYLIYTARTILEQAFKLLHHPYGWGGMYGGQDCSRFVEEVFASVGFQLPRNSGEQAQAGWVWSDFSGEATPAKKLTELAGAYAGATILPMPGHIMIYLGRSSEGMPYAIHAVWAYREDAGGTDQVRVINRVAVSNLDLGRGSQKGSLLDRLSRIVILSDAPASLPTQP